MSSWLMTFFGGGCMCKSTNCMDQPISRGNPRGEKPENGQEALATLQQQCEDDQRPRTTCTVHWVENTVLSWMCRRNTTKSAESLQCMASYAWSSISRLVFFGQVECCCSDIWLPMVYECFLRAQRHRQSENLKGPPNDQKVFGNRKMTKSLEINNYFFLINFWS